MLGAVAMPGKAPTETESRSLQDYFEALTKSVFRSGVSWGVIEARWGGLTSAFEGFDPARVARFKSDAIDRLMHDARMVRNRRKIEATVGNAAQMMAIEREYGGFERYLRSHGGRDD